MFPRGDMYIRDQKNTKGHVMGCTMGQWHPTEHAEAMTCRCVFHLLTAGLSLSLLRGGQSA